MIDLGDSMKSINQKDTFVLLEPSTPGGRVEFLREEKGLTRAKLSKNAYISASALYKYEKGILCMSPDILVRISDALGYTPNELLLHHRHTEILLAKACRGMNMEIYAMIAEINDKNFEHFMAEFVRISLQYYRIASGVVTTNPAIQKECAQAATEAALIGSGRV